LSQWLCEFSNQSYEIGPAFGWNEIFEILRFWEDLRVITVSGDDGTDGTDGTDLLPFCGETMLEETAIQLVVARSVILSHAARACQKSLVFKKKTEIGREKKKKKELNAF